LRPSAIRTYSRTTGVQFQRSFAVPQMWTGIILLGLTGVALSGLFRLVELRTMA
jgi:ABC-type nitrate/sulfonate/bicarbonate transport system permease component